MTDSKVKEVEIAAVKEESTNRGFLEAALIKINWTKYAMIIVLIILGIAFHLMTKGVFITPRNLSTLMRQVAVLGVAASGDNAPHHGAD